MPPIQVMFVMNESHFPLHRSLAVLVFILSVLGFVGCTAMVPDPPNADQFTDDQLAAFKAQLGKVVADTKKDPSYKRIPLDTEDDQKWFLKIALEYWANIIDKTAFVSEGVKRYPAYEDSFVFVADRLRQ